MFLTVTNWPSLLLWWLWWSSRIGARSLCHGRGRAITACPVLQIRFFSFMRFPTLYCFSIRCTISNFLLLTRLRWWNFFCDEKIVTLLFAFYSHGSSRFESVCRLLSGGVSWSLSDKCERLKHFLINCFLSFFHAWVRLKQNVRYFSTAPRNLIPHCIPRWRWSIFARMQ